MNCEIVIPAGMKDALLKHLLTDRSKEQMAILLCGSFFCSPPLWGCRISCFLLPAHYCRPGTPLRGRR